jgi:hypothetical protein
MIAGAHSRLAKEETMSVAKVVEITSMSPESFEQAVRSGLQRSSKTIQNIEGAWVQDQKVVLEKGRILGFQVTMKVTFVLDE